MSTLADQVGACTTVLQPLHALIERHVLAAERLHGDDTTVPILAKGKTVTGHIWQVGEIERMGRLRRFLPAQVADLIVASGTEEQLKSHRRERLNGMLVTV